MNFKLIFLSFSLFLSSSVGIVGGQIVASDEKTLTVAAKPVRVVSVVGLSENVSHTDIDPLKNSRTVPFELANYGDCSLRVEMFSIYKNQKVCFDKFVLHPRNKNRLDESRQYKVVANIPAPLLCCDIQAIKCRCGFFRSCANLQIIATKLESDAKQVKFGKEECGRFSNPVYWRRKGAQFPFEISLNIKVN